MIPKILHQVWLGDKPIPEKFLQFRNRWRQIHPRWKYILWNEENLKNTECWELIQKTNKHSSMSNIARIYAINLLGGVYADFDIEWKKSINMLLKHKAFAAKESINKYCNAFFGSEINNPWIKYQYDNIQQWIYLKPPWGPNLMTEAANKFPNDLFTIDTNLVYPYLWNQKPKGEYKDCYVIHHWARSWLSKKSTYKIDS